MVAVSKGTKKAADDRMQAALEEFINEAERHGCPPKAGTIAAQATGACVTEILEGVVKTGAGIKLDAHGAKALTISGAVGMASALTGAVGGIGGDSKAGMNACTAFVKFATAMLKGTGAKKEESVAAKEPERPEPEPKIKAVVPPELLKTSAALGEAASLLHAAGVEGKDIEMVVSEAGHAVRVAMLVPSERAPHRNSPKIKSALLLACGVGGMNTITAMLIAVGCDPKIVIRLADVFCEAVDSSLGSIMK